MVTNKNNISFYFLLSFILILFDQITKLLVKGFDVFGFSHSGFMLGESISIIGDLLQFTFVENPGMAFGIELFPDKIFLSVFRIIAALVLVYYLIKISNCSGYIKFGVSLILAGAVGNLIDSVFYGVFYSEAKLFEGRVVDFIHVDIPDIDVFGLYYSHWPVFNIADACVTVGVVILLIFHKKIPTFDKVFCAKKSTQTV